jgi:phenylacetate-coenzyme A ligase PaaK-like adenylate-forming protein
MIDITRPAGAAQLSGAALSTAIETATQRLPGSLAQRLPTSLLLECVERFAQMLRQGWQSHLLLPAQRQELLSYCNVEHLLLKLERELGDDPMRLRRINYRQAHFEAWRPLGCVLHVMPSNAPLLGFLATLESLMAGNVNWVRPSASDRLSEVLLDGLAGCDPSGVLRQHIVLWPIASADIAALLPYVDGVSAWGGDAALEALRAQLRPGCRWIAWGHKISFVYLTTAAFEAAVSAADAPAARDRLFDEIIDEVCRHSQSACSSPQLVLVDSDDVTILQACGEQLAQAFARRAMHWPAPEMETGQAASMTSTIEMARMRLAFENVQGQVWADPHWRVIWEHSCALAASPLSRTLLLRPLPRSQLCQALLTWRGYLQTCGLVCAGTEVASLSDHLLKAGVGRITAAADMHQGYIGEPHDNERALTRLARRVSVSMPPHQVIARATLDPAADASRMPDTDVPVLSKKQFGNATFKPAARLYFRSGGSTGQPQMAAYSYRDYHRQMRAAADGLYAAGLDPDTDRVLNLLYAGNLYGGLLSSFVALDKLDAVHFPMANPVNDNYEMIGEFIASQQINTLIGGPSHIYQLFHRAERRLREFGGVRKLFLGGEHISSEQRSFLASFGIPLICSAVYGSNDAGPLGHACSYSDDGVFHLLDDVQQLEIVAEHDDRPVAPGMIGRLLFSSLAREAQDVIRYDIGDLGRMLPGTCGCGLPSKRFQLLGRHGNMFAFSVELIDSTRLLHELAMPAQFVIDIQDGLDRLTVYVHGDPDVARERIYRVENMACVLQAGRGLLEVRFRNQADFECRHQSGKATIATDLRLKN